MKKIKIDSNNLLVGTFILVTGMLLGIGISTRGTFALEGRMATSSVASSTNATSTNATSTNATSTNATSTNASSTNASSANASRTDNILYLNNFSLSVESANAGDKVYVGKMTSGACNSGMSIQFHDIDNPIIQFVVNVEDLNGVPYIIIPKNAQTGTYVANKITLIGTNSDNKTFSKCYASIGVAAPCEVHTFDVKLAVTNQNTEVKKIELESLSLTEKEALIGEKVNVSYKANETITTLRLFFKSENSSFNATVLDLNNKPYFNVPSTVEAGEYSLVKAILMTDNNSIAYEEGSNFNFNTKLKVKDNTKKTYIYNNSDLNEEIIKKLYDDVELTELTVNIDNNSIISEDLFKTIIGTDRKLIINTHNNQMIFNGRDIKNPKNIDATMSTNTVASDDLLTGIISDGIVVNFVSNGDLPGNALVRVKVTEEMKSLLGNKKVNVYYFDEVVDGFNIISENITAKDGYYEFAISHNSKYILTTNKIDNSLVFAEEDNNVVGFRQTDNTYSLILCGALVLILFIIIIILFIKNKTRKD